MLTFYISMLETEEQQDKFSYIYQNYVGFMYHVAKEVVKEHYLAEDVVHETFLQLMLKMMETIDGRMVTDAPDDALPCTWLWASQT